MNKPNLFLVGSMKSGSTTLHELLAVHPQICMSEPKEPCYFVKEGLLKNMWPEMWQMGFWRSESAYLELFSAKPGAKYRGESSTDYSKLPTVGGVVERLFEYSPDARILYVMRDPVERTISHYWHMVENRGETRSPMDAIRHDAHLTQTSYYAMQLRPYLERFGNEKIRVLTFEELRGNPLGTMQSLFGWLGLDTNFVLENTSRVSNATPTEVTQRRKGGAVLNRFRHSLLWGALGRHAPPFIRRLGVTLVEKKVERRKVDMSEVVVYLRKLQQPQVQELVNLVGRDFPEWETLHGH